MRAAPLDRAGLWVAELPGTSNKLAVEEGREDMTQGKI